MDPKATPAAIQRYAGDAPSEATAQMDWRGSSGEKGTLLYRNIYAVRCVFNGQEPRPEDGVITLYLKDQSVNIEVSLYKELSKMSIASSVHALDLFGDDPMNIPFRERVGLLNSMMEKFFVISDGAVYHMKVESDASPVNVWLAEKEKEALLKNPKEKQTQDYEAIITA